MPNESNDTKPTVTVADVNKLTASRVNELFATCLSQHPLANLDDDDIIIEGIKMNVAFSKKALAIVSDDIKALISQLPENALDTSEGKGMSFISLCNDKDGELWTGFHRIIEELVMLALGINCCSYLLPKELWKALPGGMPYLVFTVTEFKE